MKVIGVDNGVSGSIAILEEGKQALYYSHKLYTKSELSYTKTKQNITRIDFNKLKEILSQASTTDKVYVERPLVNPIRFRTTMSAMRSLEATLIMLEQLGLPFSYVDSKIWQKAMLPVGVKGSAELKKAGKDVSKRLFPYISFKADEDADSLLMAEYFRRNK